jgi:hypothetical protein
MSKKVPDPFSDPFSFSRPLFVPVRIGQIAGCEDGLSSDKSETSVDTPA